LHNVDYNRGSNSSIEIFYYGYGFENPVKLKTQNPLKPKESLDLQKHCFLLNSETNILYTVA